MNPLEAALRMMAAPLPPSERPIDAERAGGTGNAAPKAEPDPLTGAAPVSVDAARGAVDGWLASGMALFGLHQVAIALRLEDARLAVIHAALPELIGCSAGKGIACDEDRYGWSPCCQTRLKLQRLGLIAAPEHAAEEDDNA
jgi:hypothetical protein